MSSHSHFKKHFYSNCSSYCGSRNFVTFGSAISFYSNLIKTQLVELVFLEKGTKETFYTKLRLKSLFFTLVTYWSRLLRYYRSVHCYLSLRSLNDSKGLEIYYEQDKVVFWLCYSEQKDKMLRLDPYFFLPLLFTIVDHS